MIGSIGFVGLGTMGGPMAQNLLKKGFSVCGYDIDADKCQRLNEAGGRAAESPQEVAGSAAVVMLSLPDHRACRDALAGPGGLVEGKTEGLLIVNSSTIGPGDAKELSGIAGAHGMRYLETPISRGIQGAIAGTLCFLVGGAEADLDEARPVLEAMGTDIYYIGPVGAGVTMKLVNNALSQGTKSLIAETIAMGVKGGLDPELILSTITQCSGDSYLLREKLPRMIARDYEPGMMIDMGYKDLNLVLALAAELRTAMPMAASAREVYGNARMRGIGRADTATLVTLYDDGFGKPE